MIGKIDGVGLDGYEDILIEKDGKRYRLTVSERLVYDLMVGDLDRRAVGIIDRWASEIMPGIHDEHIREVLREDSRRGEKGGKSEPTGTRKTMRECMSRASVLLWDGKL
jgi:hypothetical protein